MGGAHPTGLEGSVFVRQPIRQQLLRPLLAVMIASVILVAGLSAWASSSRQVSLLQTRQAAVARVLEDATFPLTHQVLRQMADLCEQEFVVWSPGQRRMVATSYLQPPDQLETILGQRADESGHVREQVIAMLGRTAVSIGVVHSRVRPTDEILILTPRRSLFDARFAAVWPPLVLGGLVLAVLMPLVLRLTRQWSRRIETIQQTVAEIARGNLAVQLESADGDDELSDLVGDIDRMRDRLGELQKELLRGERERLVAQLAAGFAHQFRNGIAGASLALELHGRRCGQSDEKSLAVARRQLTLLEAEVRGILALAKSPESPRTVVDMATLAADAAELVAPNLDHHRITLSCSRGAGDVVVEGHVDSLRAAILNLLLNGIDAAGPGGNLRIETRRADGRVIVSVADDGAGPAPEVAQRLTEAFVTTKPEGVGLGLTIVVAAAHDHGGQFSWRRDGSWTVMEISLPPRVPSSESNG